MKLFYKLVITAVLFLIPSGFGAEMMAPKFDKTFPIYDTISDTVTATIYNEGFQTASGIWVDQKNPEKHRIIAISRDLKGRYNFGDSVYIMGTNEYDGVYYVEDLMNERWTKRIDILINPKDGLNKFYNVRILKL